MTSFPFISTSVLLLCIAPTASSDILVCFSRYHRCRLSTAPTSDSIIALLFASHTSRRTASKSIFPQGPQCRSTVARPLATALAGLLLYYICFWSCMQLSRFAIPAALFDSLLYTSYILHRVYKIHIVTTTAQTSMHVSHLPVTDRGNGPLSLILRCKAQVLVTDRPRMTTSQHHDPLHVDKKKSHPRRTALDL
jgi:hypothetical protein